MLRTDANIALTSCAVSAAQIVALIRNLSHIYQALIRSILHYGWKAYHSASSSILSQLDRVQSYALRICCGAMKCSPVSALQVECGEMPLDLRRESFQLKYAINIEAIKDNSASGILKERNPIKRKKSSFATKKQNHSRWKWNIKSMVLLFQTILRGATRNRM